MSLTSESLDSEPFDSETSTIGSYYALVHESHALANILRRAKPQFQEQVSELQGIVTRAHQKLEKLDEQERAIKSLNRFEARRTILRGCISGERAAALTNLQAAHQTLRYLRHCKKSED